jgi:hypothetical protein
MKKILRLLFSLTLTASLWAQIDTESAPPELDQRDLLWAASACSQTEGTIKGVVFDENGKPLPGASVYVQKTDEMAVHFVPRPVQTNDEGRFLIEHVSWGSYIVIAGKEEAGYPSTWARFYSNGVVPKVTVESSSATADATVLLGPKVGILRLASVTDALTGKDISVFGVITLERANTANSFLTTSTSKARLFVPARTDVTIHVTAPGYRPWPDQTDKEQIVHLQPGEVFDLHVKVQPESPDPTIADLLMELGEKKEILFTLEEPSGVQQALSFFRFPRPPDVAELNSILDNMSRQVPNFSYERDPRNPRIIHVIDRRMAGQQGYALDAILDHIDFSGPLDRLVRAVSDKSGYISSILIPGPYPLLNVDLRSKVTLKADGITARDALSEIAPVEKKGGILWSAQTELGKKQPTILTFCCAPTLN